MERKRSLENLVSQLWINKAVVQKSKVLLCLRKLKSSPYTTQKQKPGLNSDTALVHPWHLEEASVCHTALPLRCQGINNLVFLLGVPLTSVSAVSAKLAVPVCE